MTVVTAHARIVQAIRSHPLEWTKETVLSLDAICVHESACGREVEPAICALIVMQERIKVEIVQHVT